MPLDRYRQELQLLAEKVPAARDLLKTAVSPSEKITFKANRPDCIQARWENLNTSPVLRCTAAPSDQRNYLDFTFAEHTIDKPLMLTVTPAAGVSWQQYSLELIFDGRPKERAATGGCFYKKHPRKMRLLVEPTDRPIEILLKFQ